MLRNKCWTRLSDLYVCMCVIRPISTVSRNVNCLWLIHIRATANSWTVMNENVLLGFFWEGGDSNKKVVLGVIAEKMKMCTYLHVRNNPYPLDVSYSLDQFQVMCSRISIIWHLHDWRGATSLSIPFIKQHLHWPKFLQEIVSLCFSFYLSWSTIPSCVLP